MRRLLLVLVDVLLVGFATIGALLLRDNFETTQQKLIDLVPYLLASLAFASVALPSVGLDRSIWRFTTLADAMRLVLAAVTIVSGSVAFSFALNRMDGVARAVPIIQGVLIVAFMLGARALVRAHHASRRRPVQLTSVVGEDERGAVLVVGLGPLTHAYLQAIAEVGEGKVRIAGLLGRTDRHVGRIVGGHTVLGTPEQVEEVIRDLAVHGVFIQRIDVTTPFPSLSPAAQDALIRIRDEGGIPLEFVAARLVGLHAPQAPVPTAMPDPKDKPLERSPEPSFELSPENLKAMSQRKYWVIKRIFDLALATALLVILSPLIVLVALLAAIDVGLPITFWQERPGLGGRPFRLYKLRSMAAAHDVLGRRVPDDQRISPIGKFLRRTRLDELPQLLHIIRGDMSFVGPRPLLPVDQPPAYAARLLVRPGLTGWAQVRGGREISAHDKAALDVWYVQNASFRLDLEILALTVPMVLRGERVCQSSVDKAWEDLTRSGICRRPG